jgi:hypothetical protein
MSLVMNGFIINQEFWALQKTTPKKILQIKILVKNLLQNLITMQHY